MSYITIKSDVLRKACQKAIEDITNNRNGILLKEFNKVQNSIFAKIFRLIFRTKKKKPTEENLKKYMKRLSVFSSVHIQGWLIEEVAISLLGMCDYTNEVAVSCGDFYYIEKYMT